MESAILYTFSTIVQALAGAFALVGAFVLYRLAAYDTAMWDDSGTLLNGVMGSRELGMLRGRRDYAGFLELLDKVLATRRAGPDGQGEGPDGPFTPEQSGRLVHLREALLATAGIKRQNPPFIRLSNQTRLYISLNNLPLWPLPDEQLSGAMPIIQHP